VDRSSLASTARPQGVRNRSTDRRRMSTETGPDLDMVVASGRIPQDVVVLGLDWGRAGGVHSVGRPGPREDPEGTQGVEAGRGETADSASQGPGWRHIPRELAAMVSIARTGNSEARTSPTRGDRDVEPESGRKVGGRREVGRPADARTPGERPSSRNEYPAIPAPRDRATTHSRRNSRRSTSNSTSNLTSNLTSKSTRHAPQR
jgi:hypothetical protein